MSVPTKSVRNLAVDLATADNHDFASNDERFNSIFSMLDKDGNGTLDKEEAYALVRQWDQEKGQNAHLRKKMWTLIGISSAVIALLAGSTFGATFVAVHASKDTKVASSGALMSKDGSRQLSTIAHGNRIPVLNTTDDAPLCISLDDYELIKEGVYQGEKVVLDVEAEEDGSHGVQVLGDGESYITEDRACYNVNDDNKRICFEKANCATQTHRALWESRGLSSDGAQSCDCTENWSPYACGRVVNDPLRGWTCKGWDSTW